MRFDSYHPAIAFLYFTAALTVTITFVQPVFLIISFLSGLSYSVYYKVKGAKKWNWIPFLIIPVVASYYTFGHHFGDTYLIRMSSGNYITLESGIYGLVLGIIMSSTLLWLSFTRNIVTTDKIVYLFGRISPKLSLYFAMILRLVPCICHKMKAVIEAQAGIGKGITSGTVGKRIRNLCKILSIVFTWTLDYMKECSVSMKSRGYSLKGRTAFSIYRFDNRDRVVVIGIVFLITMLCVGAALDQSRTVYNPELVMNRITPVSLVFYCVYGVFTMLPFLLESRRKEVKW